MLPSSASGNSIVLIDKINGTPVAIEQTPNFINEFFNNIGPEDFNLPWQDNMKSYSVLDPMPELVVTEEVIDSHKSSAIKNY